MPGTHSDRVCRSKTCHAAAQEGNDVKAAGRIAQRIQRRCTGYYCGYTFKKQPTGKKCLRGAAESLNYLTTGLEDKTPGQQWHRISHRVLTDLQHRVMRRTAPEEFNLALSYEYQDLASAEFVRTYRSVDFKGGVLVRRLEAEKSGAAVRENYKAMPAATEDKDAPWLRHFDDLYGFRGNHASIFLLSPWEFLMLWEVVPIQSSSVIDVNDSDTVAYPRLTGNLQLRDKFYMRKGNGRWSLRRPGLPCQAKKVHKRERRDFIPCT